MKILEKRKLEFDNIKKKKPFGGIGIMDVRKRIPLSTLSSKEGGTVGGNFVSPRAVRKGQVKIDFIFALVFFTAIIFYIGVQINGAMTSNLADSRLDALKSEAESVLDVLASTEGVPKNWEALPDDKVVRIGLAQSSYNLSSVKVAALNNRCDLMNKFGSISYRLSITSGGITLLSCGYGGPRVTSRAERPVLVGGNYGKMTLEMW